MSIQSKLYVDDKVFVILNSRLHYYQHADTNGRPTSMVFGGLWDIVIESTKDDLFTEWAVHPTMMKHIKIAQTPISMNGKSRTFELFDVHCIFDKNHFDGRSKEPMKNYITLSPAQMKLNGVLMHQWNWKVTDLDAKNVATTTIDEEIEEEEPTIDSLKWFGAEDDKEINSVEFGDSVRAFIEVTNIDVGETLDVELYAKSGGEFDTSNRKHYQAKVENRFGGKYAICEIDVKENWKINVNNPKTNNIDSLIIKASFDSVSNDFSSNGLDIVAEKLQGIFLQKGKDETYYYQGKLYSATQDKKGMVPYNEKPRRQFKETKEALDKIYEKPKGKAFIDGIIERSNPKFIIITRIGATNSTTGIKVSWSPGDKYGGIDEKGNTKRPPFFSLAHELWHAWENWNNPTMLNPVWVAKTDKTPKLMHKEMTASTFENEIRNEHNFPKRKWYAYVDENGKKTGFGQIF